MSTSMLISALLLALVYQSQCFRPEYQPTYFREGTEAAGDPLILTPLIEDGKIKEAVAAAEVKFDDFQDVKSYSGFLTVDKKYNGNLFFWYFPAVNRPLLGSAPVLLWLQGGPGSSSMFGLFTENGPFNVAKNGTVTLRNTSWNQEFDLIFIDSPVGTGFSFVDDGGYAEDQTKVGEDLYTAMSQFFLLFPDLADAEFFVTGESYGGKYVPALANTIHDKNQNKDNKKINLGGIIIGNGLTDPINQQNYADYFYQLGLIDENARLDITSIQEERADLIKRERYEEASELFDKIIGMYIQITQLNNYYNYLLEDNVPVHFEKYIQSDAVRQAIHVGAKRFNGVNPVHSHLYADMSKSMASNMTTLINNYRTLLYNGELDIIVAYVLTENYLMNLDFDAAEDYREAVRGIWSVGSEVAGFYKTAGNLTEVMVRTAGHMVPADQPNWALDLITRFVRNESLS